MFESGHVVILLNMHNDNFRANGAGRNFVLRIFIFNFVNLLPGLKFYNTQCSRDVINSEFVFDQEYMYVIYIIFR